MGMLDNMLVDPAAAQGGLPKWLSDLLASGRGNQNAAAAFGALTPAVVGQGGVTATPDAKGVYGQDAVMLPPAAGPVSQSRPPDAPPMGDDAFPPNATPTSGPAPFSMTPSAPTASPPSAAGPGLFDRMSAASHNLGARPGLPGIFDAISGAQTGQRLDPQGMALQGQNATVRALVAKGVSPDLAEAARLNPEILKQLLPAFGPKAYQFQTTPDGAIIKIDPTGRENPTPVYQSPTKGKLTQIGEDAFGGKTFGYVDEVGRKTYDLKGNLIGGPGATTGDGANSGTGGDSFFAKGVTAIDHDLTGNDYLKQFSPEVQAAVKSYVGGESMPTGNPRKGFTQTIKMIAQKYGNDIGTPADDVNFAQRRQMLNNLAVSTPASLGGQINFAGTALEHLASTAEKIGELKNVGGLGLAPIARLSNMVRQLTTEQAGKANAVTGAAQHYGQEVTKFYSGSPGGEAERSRFMNTLNTAKSPTELADALQTERDLIPGRLDQISNQIRTTLGENSAQAQKYLARIEESKKSIPRIDAEIAKLRGQAPQAPTTAAPSVAAQKIAPGNYNWTPNGLVPQ